MTWSGLNVFEGPSGLEPRVTLKWLVQVKPRTRAVFAMCQVASSGLEGSGSELGSSNDFERKGAFESGWSNNFERKGGFESGWSSDFELKVTLSQAGAGISSPPWLWSSHFEPQ